MTLLFGPYLCRQKSHFDGVKSKVGPLSKNNTTSLLAIQNNFEVLGKNEKGFVKEVFIVQRRNILNSVSCRSVGLNTNFKTSNLRLNDQAYNCLIHL